MADTPGVRRRHSSAARATWQEQPLVTRTDPGRASDADGLRASSGALRSAAVRRGQLLRRLGEVGDEVPLILLLAPSGYGKTTALAQWTAESGRRFAWAALQGNDNNVGHLLRHIAAALLDADLLDGSAWSAPGADESSVADRLIARMVTALRRSQGPSMLVLDDLHHVGSSPALNAVVSLAASLPAGWHVVVAGRRPLRISLEGKKVAYRCVRFEAADLAFRPSEAARLFSALGVDLSMDLVRGIVQRTEGWPAGVALAALSAASRADSAFAAEAIYGDDRYVMDYFRDEVLAHQSPATVRFLLRTSALDSFSGPLCDAALDTTGSAAWISQIETENLFLVPQDNQGEWFRYHRLFAEMLLSELRRREPGEERRIHRRAAEWFEEQQRPEDAIKYAAAGGDRLRIERLVLTRVKDLVGQGRLAIVRAGLDVVGRDRIEHDLRLALVDTWVSALLGDARRARGSLHVAETRSAGSAVSRSELAAGVARARAALAPDGIAGMKADAERALELEPPASPWHALSLALFGSACLLMGSTNEAKQAFDSAVRFARTERGPSLAYALAQRSLLAADDREWVSAGEYSADSLRIVENAGLQEYPSSVATHAACARVALHDGDPNSAWQHAMEAYRIYRHPSPAAFPWLAAQAAVILGRFFLDVAQQNLAAYAITEAARYLRLLGGEGAIRESVDLLITDMNRAIPSDRAPGTGILTPSEMKVLQLLPSHLSLAEISKELFVSRNTVKKQVSAIYRKLEVTNRAEAVRKARRMDLL